MGQKYNYNSKPPGGGVTRRRGLGMWRNKLYLLIKNHLQ